MNAPLRFAEPSLAHSKGKPGVFTTTFNINVRFASFVADSGITRTVETRVEDSRAKK
jgi:hypothetical protein